MWAGSRWGGNRWVDDSMSASEFEKAAKVACGGVCVMSRLSVSIEFRRNAGKILIYRYFHSPPPAES